MRKKAILRGLLGIPMGITICYVFTIVFSLFLARGSYVSCSPQLEAAVGSQIGAVVVQLLLSAIIGAGFAAASVVWEIGEWSIVRQTGTCFAIYGVLMFPIAYVANWMGHTVWGVLSYVVIFVVIFVVMWLIFYLIWKKKVRQLNCGIKKGL